MCTKEQLLLLANGMILSKIIYCISVWADVNKALKQKVQAVITEMYRIMSGDYHSSVQVLHEKHEVFSLDGVVAEVNGLVEAAQRVLLRREPDQRFRI